MTCIWAISIALSFLSSYIDAENITATPNSESIQPGHQNGRVIPRFNYIQNCNSLSFGHVIECICYRELNGDYCQYNRWSGQCARPSHARRNNRTDWIYLLTEDTDEDSKKPEDGAMDLGVSEEHCDPIWSRIQTQSTSMSDSFQQAELSIHDFVNDGNTNRTLTINGTDSLNARPKKQLLEGTIAPHLIYTNGRIQQSVISYSMTRLMANMILKAEHEILLQAYIIQKHMATTRAIGEAMLEVQRRLNESTNPVDKNRKILALFLESHVEQLYLPGYKRRSVEDYGLPALHDLPNFEFQIKSVHTTWRGSMHSKSLIIDRRVALITSGNVKDAFLELGVVVEGHDLIESLRADFFFSWTRLMVSPVASGLDVLKQLETLDTDGPNLKLELEDDVPPFNASALGATQILDRTPIWIDNSALDLPLLHQSDMEVEFKEPRGNYPMMVVSRRPVEAYKLWSQKENNPAFRSLISLINNAKEYILIATPNMNVNKIIDALVRALERGVKISMTTGYGLNDGLARMAGGTNLHSYKQFWRYSKRALNVNDTVLQQQLKLCWSTMKNQTHPVVGDETKTSHIKFMSVDHQTTYLGSTNLDDQSIHASQELNIIVDGHELTTKLEEMIIETQGFERSCFPQFP